MRWKILISILLFLVTLCVYEVQYPTTRSLSAGGFESLALAHSLAEHGTFANPFPFSTGASAQLAPGYPAFLAILIRSFGYEEGRVVLKWIVLWVVALELSLFPFFTERLRMGFATGLLASIAWLTAVLPLSFEWEASLVGAMTVLLTYLIFELKRSATGTRVVTVGVLWGVLLLLNPVVLLVLLAFLLWLCFWKEMSARKKAALALIPVLIIAPWIVRNYITFGHFVFIRDNFGLELAVSNNSCVTYSWAVNLDNGCLDAMYPNQNPAQAAQVKELGEVKYGQMKLQEAKRWILANPRPFLHLTLRRFLAFWFPSGPIEDDLTSRTTVMVYLMTLLSIPGLVLLWIKSRELGGYFLVWLTMFPSIYYFVQFSSRYRRPVLWITFVLGSYTIQALATGVWKATKQASS